MAAVIRGPNPKAGAWVVVSFLLQSTMPPLIFPPDSTSVNISWFLFPGLYGRVARDAPIVSVAHGWGGGVEA